MVDEGCFNPWCVGPLSLGQIRGAIAPGPYDLVVIHILSGDVLAVPNV
jgi:hypothetical protein